MTQLVCVWQWLLIINWPNYSRTWLVRHHAFGYYLNCILHKLLMFNQIIECDVGLSETWRTVQIDTYTHAYLHNSMLCFNWYVMNLLGNVPSAKPGLHGNQKQSYVRATVQFHAIMIIANSEIYIIYNYIAFYKPTMNIPSHHFIHHASFQSLRLFHCMQA